MKNSTSYRTFIQFLLLEYQIKFQKYKQVIKLNQSKKKMTIL
jgi:hypothetical protein